MGKSLDIAQAELRQAIEAVQEAMAAVEAYACMVTAGASLDRGALLTLQSAVERVRCECEAMVRLRLGSEPGTVSR